MSTPANQVRRREFPPTRPCVMQLESRSWQKVPHGFDTQPLGEIRAIARLEMLGRMRAFMPGRSGNFQRAVPRTPFGRHSITIGETGSVDCSFRPGYHASDGTLA